jgi:hypothetical protein
MSVMYMLVMLNKVCLTLVHRRRVQGHSQFSITTLQRTVIKREPCVGLIDVHAPVVGNACNLGRKPLSLCIFVCLDRCYVLLQIEGHYICLGSQQ